MLSDPTLSPPQAAGAPARLRTALALVTLAALLVASWWFGWSRYASLEYVQSCEAELRAYHASHPAQTIAAYLAVSVLVAGLWGLAAVPLSIVAGALFGTVLGTTLSSFAITTGDLLACLASRYLWGGMLQVRHGGPIAAIRREIERDGVAYLFMLRLIPVVPAVLVNGAMGLTSMRLWTFWWVTQLGTLPGRFLYANAGTQLGRLEPGQGLWSPALLASLAALAIFPLVVKKLFSLRLRFAPPVQAGQESAEWSAARR